MPGELVLKALEHLWKTLAPLRLPMAVMGGIALSAWEYVRSTKDVDILIHLGVVDLEKLLAILHQAGFRPLRQPPVLTVGSMRFMQLGYEPPGTFLELQVDLLFADSEYQRAALARRVPLRLEGLEQELFILSCEDLILFKLLAGRLRDRADVMELLRLNRPALDLVYLVGWAEWLGLTREWAEAWREAFPGESLPIR
jgi:hypothetical protein